jgi:hypothetical protein
MTGVPSGPSPAIKHAARPGTTIRWTLHLGLEEALGLLYQAIAATDFTAVCLGPDRVEVHVPRSLWKRRRAAALVASVSSSGGVTAITWAGPDDTGQDQLAVLEELLPDGAVFDHGIQDAARAAGLASPDKKLRRSLAAGLYGDERIQALGTGVLSGQRGTLALTDRRLLFHRNCAPRQASFNYALDVIEALTLGKKTSGETLTVTLPGASVVITHLGHGEGYGIARKFRESREGMPPAEATAVTARDPRNPPTP